MPVHRSRAQSMSDLLLYPIDSIPDLPESFPSPFEVTPHPIAAAAAHALKARLPALTENLHNFDVAGGGKMFGILVVQDRRGSIAYLSAFSGMLGEQWHQPGFVPPAFDLGTRDNILVAGETEIADITHEIELLESSADFLSAKGRLRCLDDEAIDKLATMKNTNAVKKAARHITRKQPGIAQSELSELNQQSRQDKFAYKKLKQELLTNSKTVRETVTLHESGIESLKRKRKRLSTRLQRDAFTGYTLVDRQRQSVNMIDLFEALPPSGAGDCAAIKLVQYANLNQLTPVALAEFWWGAPPNAGMRKHGRYYPACRSRCRVLLPRLLQGLTIATPKHEVAPSFDESYPQTLFEDDQLLVVLKPEGMLSVPGKVLSDSVETRIKARYPEVTGSMLLHRLDQATSGVMIAAKNPEARRLLQHQFQERTIDKKYVAVLDGVLPMDEGVIELPLRIDIYDRPRQLVCFERGKSAQTRFEVIERDDARTRVAFYPLTGRTHQLRMHAAHSAGLNCPILGDELYGESHDRLYLHAQKISFNHPTRDERITLSAPDPF